MASALPRWPPGVQGVIRTFARELAVVESRLVDVDPAAGADEVAHHLLGELEVVGPPTEVGRDGGRAPDAVDRRPAARRRRRDRGGDRRRPRPRSRLGRRRHRRRPRHHRPGRRSRWPAPPGAASSWSAARRCPAPSRADLAGASRRGGGAPGDHPSPASTAARPRSRRPLPRVAGRAGDPGDPGGARRVRRLRSATTSLDVRDTAAARGRARRTIRHEPRPARRRRPRAPASSRTSCSATRRPSRSPGCSTPRSARPRRHRRRRRRADGLRSCCSAASSGVFGNRGQVDYAAANDALDGIARRARAGRARRRVVAVDWGPWAGTGMVSPELDREYERRGIGLIDPDEGVGRRSSPSCAAGGPDPQVVVPCAPRPEAAPRRLTCAPEPTSPSSGWRAVFPGAPDLAAFWPNIVGGVDAISDVPPDRVDPVFFEPAAERARPLLLPARRVRRPAVPLRPVRLRHHARGRRRAPSPTSCSPSPPRRRRSPTPATSTGVPDPPQGRRRPRAGRLPRPPAIARLDQRVRTAHQLVACAARAGPRPRRRPLAAVRDQFQAGARPDAPRGVDRPGAQPRRLARRQPPRPPRPGLHRRRRLRRARCIAVDQAVDELASRAAAT